MEDNPFSESRKRRAMAANGIAAPREGNRAVPDSDPFKVIVNKRASDSKAPEPQSALPALRLPSFSADPPNQQIGRRQTPEFVSAIAAPAPRSKEPIVRQATELASLIARFVGKPESQDNEPSPQKSESSSRKIVERPKPTDLVRAISNLKRRPSGDVFADAAERQSPRNYLPEDRSKNPQLAVPGRHLEFKDPLRLALPVRMSDIDPRVTKADIKSPVHAGNTSPAVWEKRASQIKAEWEQTGSEEFEDVMLGVKLLESYRPPIPLKQELLEKAAALSAGPNQSMVALERSIDQLITELKGHLHTLEIFKNELKQHSKHSA